MINLKNTFFTADWHLSDPRIGINGELDLLHRNVYNLRLMHNQLMQNIHETDIDNSPETTIYHLGDVMYKVDKDSVNFLEKFRFIYDKVNLVLIRGNYDQGDEKNSVLFDYFDEVVDDKSLFDFGGYNVYLNHYPLECKSKLLEEPYDFAITGHIHGWWKVQRTMINVGVDAWHFRPVSGEKLVFIWNAIQKHFDDNVFPYDPISKRK
jgi:calcineurin-like phosphoesterase family protein